MTLHVFGQQVKGWRRRERFPETEHHHITSFCVIPELVFHPVSSLLQSNLIMSFRHILLSTDRKIGE